MPTTLTANEESQLLQTIEMFEVITQEQPLDYQSLEILKEAYFKLGRQREVIQTSKRIAQAYMQLGQLSSAILEYEGILQKFPDDPEVKTALAEIEAKATSLAGGGPPDTDLSTKDTSKLAKSRGEDGKPASTDIDDGRQAMQKIFVEGKLLTATDFDIYWPTVDPAEIPTSVVEPFIQVLADKGVLPIEKSLKLLCDKTRLGFIPVEKYDVDVELARQFSKDVCRRWCVLPFDRMSKAVLVVTANPFNKQAARELESTGKHRLVWYLSPPADLVKSLRKVFR